MRIATWRWGIGSCEMYHMGRVHVPWKSEAVNFSVHSLRRGDAFDTNTQSWNILNYGGDKLRRSSLSLDA